MMTAAHLGAGLALALVGWLLLRRIAGTRGAPLLMRLLDLAPVLIGWCVLTGATARPGFAGIVILALALGLGLVDHTKRIVLREPVIFSDISELVQVFTHPELYLPFAPRGLLYGGGALLVAAALALLPLEPPVWPLAAWHPVLAAALLLALILGLSRPPLLDHAAAWFRTLAPHPEPADNMRRFGTLGTFLTHGMIARSERPARRRRAQQSAAPAIIARRPRSRAPIIVVQSESFFDPRRLGPGIAPHLLPHFDALGRRAVQRGRLDTPGWGANTMRTEFGVLTGLSDRDLGYDRFNPYHAFAHEPVPSLASRFRAEGYRSIALHPYSRNFYRRDRIFPLLGFHEYHGLEAFEGAPRQNGFVSDGALAEALVDRLDDGVFLFAMTMENHGPWLTDDLHPLGFEPAPGLPSTPAFVPLRRYLAGIASADAMLGRLAAALEAAGGGTLAFYGDHLPSLPESFDAVGFDDTHSDYLLWTVEGGSGRRSDIAAHALSGLILETALDARAPALALPTGTD